MKNKKLNKLLNYKLFLVSQNDIDLEIKVNLSEDVDIIFENAVNRIIYNFDSINSLKKKIKLLIIDGDSNIFIKLSNPYSKKIFF